MQQSSQMLSLALGWLSRYIHPDIASFTYSVRGISSQGFIPIPSKSNSLTSVCQKCGVKFVDSRIRRYQMGYIKLACPLTHVWYLKGFPSYIANVLDKPRNPQLDF